MIVGRCSFIRLVRPRLAARGNFATQAVQFVIRGLEPEQSFAFLAKPHKFGRVTMQDLEL